MIFELWHSASECSYLYVAKNANYEETMRCERVITPDLVLEWTYEAKSYFEAQQARYQYLGWGDYKPEPGWDDIIYDS
jgi:hypothetical protein